jgi:predicted P-loop ATPase
VLHVANSDLRSEPRDWIRGLTWDGWPRLAQLMTKGFGCSESDYVIVVGENLMKAIVARAERPGCKVDHVVVLEGAQGIGKSQGVEIIGGPWYGSLHSSMGSKDFIQELMGKLVAELDELAGLPKREFEISKSVISRRQDTLRLPYGRHPVDVPRQTVFVGSTNESAYLRDPTGARRFVPVRCGSVDLRWIEIHRTQLFAEAAARLKRGEPWWDLPVDDVVREQEERYADDPWADPIERYLIGKSCTTMAYVLSDGLRIELARQDKSMQMRAARVLERCGWRRAQVEASRRRVWLPPDAAGGSGGSNVVRLNAEGNHRHEPPEPPELLEGVNK